MNERVQRCTDRPADQSAFKGWEGELAAGVAMDQLGRLLAPLAVADSASHMDVISRVIETQVIPHLISLHRERTLADDTREVVELTRRSIDMDPDAAGVFVEQMIARGIGHDTICLDLLAPAARRLGVLWENDLCDFSQVTIGLLRLQRLLQDISRTARLRADRGGSGRSALLTTVPGEQHSFGIAMVAEFFRREGWYVYSRPISSAAELALLVRNEWFGIAALSAATEPALITMRSCVEMIRATSCNQSIAIIVGGPPFIERPELVEFVGADGTAVDAREAAQRAEMLLVGQAARD